MKRSAFKDILEGRALGRIFRTSGDLSKCIRSGDVHDSSSSTLQGVTPPPGLYFQDIWLLLYDGSAGASRSFEFGGHVVAGVMSSPGCPCQPLSG